MLAIDKNIIFKRFNDAVYDIALSAAAERKDDNDSFSKHKKDAGEAISQTLEYSLKFHLNRNLSEPEKRFFQLNRQDLPKLIEKYIDENGNDNGYLYNTIEESIEPSVDFKYLLLNKNAITNASKHEAKALDFNIQKQYLEEVRKFINQYIDDKQRLKTINDFESPDFSSWDLFYSACDRFSKEERNYILVIGRNQSVDAKYLKNLAIPRWDLIVDFDYNSEKDGFFKFGYKEGDVLPHIFKATDIVSSNSFSQFSQSHYHYFANNYKGSGENEPKDYSDWNRKVGKNTELFLKSYSEVFSTQKNIVLILYNSRRYINFLCEKIEQFLGSNTSFIFANDFQDELLQVCEDFNGIKINISIAEIASGFANFSSNFGISNPFRGQYMVPFLDTSETKDVTGILPPDVFAQFEEYFEVVHKGLPDTEEGESDRRSFLCGETKLTWNGLKNRYDVERQSLIKRYVKQVEKVIENGRGKILLVHDAGFGGTSIARRIAWEIHNDNPTLILKKYKDIKIKERIIDLHQRTRKTIFVVLEVPQSITMDEVDNLYRSIPQARPVVFLIVKRGKPHSNELVVTDWGNDTIDLINAYKPFLYEFKDTLIRDRKMKELDEIPNSSETYKKTPFYIGLLTFEENFFALKDYIRTFVIEIQNKEEQKRVLIYLSICYDYLGQGLPSSFFKKLFKVSELNVFKLEDYFSQDSLIMDSLMVTSYEGNHRFWKIKHNFFAKELKKQILSGESQNQEIWRQGLADACVKFIEDSNNDNVGTEYIQETLQKLFIGNRKDRAGEDFTPIINDIISIDDKEQVFLALKNTYPENPHYCSHLARFYAYHNKNREKALLFADEAIRLSEIEGISDSLLYHIKGMCLRSIAYEIMNNHRRKITQKDNIQEFEYKEVIDKLIPEAELEFERSREIAKKQNKIDEYGYVAHIQLLINAIDYGIVISGKSKQEFFKLSPEPFTDWLDLAETLLEEVKRVNLDNDDSGKIEDCVNQILSFYENYEQILQNLRSQLEKGKNPSRTRRQIVRTYFRKKENYAQDIKIVNNILSLMEQNIDNEPDNEKNYYLWFQAARYSRLSLDEAINKLSKWKANSSSLDAIFYFYILKVFRSLQGYSESTVDAVRLIKECKSKGRSNITIYEWCGKGTGLRKFIHRSEINKENKDEKLELITGYFTEYLHDGSGKITIADMIEVFFSPVQAKLTSNDLNKEVEFYLGFSYDGPRADSYSVRIRGQEPRNNEPQEEIEQEVLKYSASTISTKGDDKSENPIPKSLQKRLKGKVIELKYPPNYVMGNIESEYGKNYFFHKNNEKPEIFSKLKIGTLVSFDSVVNDKGLLAKNIIIIDED